MALPSQIAKLIRQFDPRGLLPYEIVEGMPRHRPCPIDDHVREYEEVNRAYFFLPDMEARLLHACEILERALMVQQCPLNMMRTDSHMKMMREKFTAEGWCCKSLQQGIDHKPDLVYFVAGGFVVSELLGHGDWSDIDVWLRPSVDRQHVAWLVAGRSVYPTNIMLVSDAHDQISIFDLDICKCAIECAHSQGKTRYRFVLTQSCALAWMHNCVHMVQHHPAGFRLASLNAFLGKYSCRDLDIDDCLQDRCKYTLPALTKMPPASLQQGKAYWIIATRAGQLSAVSFTLLKKNSTVARHVAQMELAMKSCPAVLYPCSHVFNSRYFSSHADRHWLNCCISSSCACVAFSNSMRVLSNLVLPSWLTSRSNLDAAAVTLEISTLLPRLPDSVHSTKGQEKFIIECALPASSLSMMKDWRAGNAESLYDVSDSIYVDTRAIQEIPTVMLCVSRQRICTSCAHDSARAMQCSGWPEI